MTLLVTLAIPFLLLAFWVWMFYDMLHNEDIPSFEPGFRWPPLARNQWLLCFVFFNFFAAGYYYFTEYKK